VTQAKRCLFMGDLPWFGMSALRRRPDSGAE
jgi:hypothetical protein